MRQRIAFTFSLLISLFVGCFGGIFVYEKYFDGKEKTITEVNNKVINEVSVTENDTIQPGIAKIYDAVYYIASYRNKSLYSSGTGFAYKKDDKYGYIMTNQHVIEHATKILVTMADDSIVEAELLGSDLEVNMTDSTAKNLKWRVDCEFGATSGKTELATCAKKYGLDAIHDTVHEMARDEARHGKAFEGLYDRYFGK